MLRARLFLVISSLSVALAWAQPVTLPLPLDDSVKFASGTVNAIDASRSLMIVSTAAGPVTFHTDQAAVIGLEKQPINLRTLGVGHTVNIWYVVKDGAIAKEIDLVLPAPHAPPVSLVALPVSTGS
jgi:hypothetical protein